MDAGWNVAMQDVTPAILSRKAAESRLKNGWKTFETYKGRARVRVRLDRARLGNLGDNRSVGEGVHEFRIAHGPGYRVYFGLEGNRLILLLLGGDKSTQQKDIARAKEYWRDHQRRTGDG